MKARELYEKAHEAGMKAGNEVGVRPMIVGSPTTAFGSDIDYSKKTYVVEGGVCGFAGVVIKPARGKFVAFLKENEDVFDFRKWRFGDELEAPPEV